MPKTVEAPAAESIDAARAPDVNAPYNIPCAPSQLVRGNVRPGQNLSEILLSYKIPPDVVHAAGTGFKDVFDARKLRAGNAYSIICEPDRPDAARFFIYEQNPVEYVVFDLRNPPNVYTGSKAVESRIREEAGTISGSLWEAFSERQIHFELAMRLADVFAWTIDFHHLQPDDRFWVIFEENYVEDQPAGFGKILAARFNHGAKDFYAFHFAHDRGEGFYDENGKSLKRAFLKAPLKYDRISSKYSLRRFHPVLKDFRPHLGTDYAAAAGTPIMAVGDGVVLEARADRNNGKYVKIKHNRTYSTQYLHMSKFQKGIRPGVSVRQGDVIGYVGSTGLATGPHLCFRFWKNGKQVNPLKEEIAYSEPLGEKLMGAYRERTADLKSRLDSPVFAENSEPKAGKG